MLFYSQEKDAISDKKLFHFLLPLIRQNITSDSLEYLQKHLSSDGSKDSFTLSESEFFSLIFVVAQYEH